MGGRGGVAVLGLLGGGGCVGKQPSTMPNVVVGWFCSLLGMLGFWAGNCAFGSALISYIHLGCFGATAGGGIGRKKNVTGLRSPSLPIRQPARLGKRCQWACSRSILLLGSLGLVFLSKKNVI